MEQRREKDSLGDLEVPAAAYYGIQTQRAVLNFSISGIRASDALLNAVIQVKKAAAAVNLKLGKLPPDKSGAIVKACDEILSGRFREQFVVDVFQMGAGTSFHMNCNEVIANRAGEILGGAKGSYKIVHPNDHVNMGQSTNDVFPTAIRLAVLSLLRDKLFGALNGLEGAFKQKAGEFKNVIKSGRTHLQDAAPVLLGQEFAAYGKTLENCRKFLEQASKSLCSLGIGGSAVGTGLNTHPEYAGLMLEHIKDQTGLPLTGAEDLREAMQSMRPFAEVSAALRSLAAELNRIANDLRLLSSGPKTGFAEIELPAVAPGSSMMPGKINPSMLEMLNMVCYQVIGCDQAVLSAAQAGQLELNVMMPVISFNLTFMIRILANAMTHVKKLCVDGIKADRDRCRKYAESSPGIVTAIAPHIGYAAAAQIAKESLDTGKSLVDLIIEKRLMSDKQVKEILDPEKMTKPAF